MRWTFANTAVVSSLSLGSLLTSPGSWGQTAQVTPPVPVNVEAIGPRIGERVPEFRLNDQSGKEWTREAIMGPKGAMLVFFRSADW